MSFVIDREFKFARVLSVFPGQILLIYIFLLLRACGDPPGSVLGPPV